jgi:hypothetical protein
VGFNDPRAYIQGENTEFNLELFTDNRKTILEIKQRMAQKLGLSVNEFLLRQTASFGKELTDYNQKLHEIKLRSFGNIFL